MTNTTKTGTITKAEWLVIRDAYKAAYARYAAATKAYRSMDIGDGEFLAAKKALADAQDSLDLADSMSPVGAYDGR